MVFQCINIRQVPWEVLKTAAFGLGFHTSHGTWRMLMQKNHVLSLYRLCLVYEHGGAECDACADWTLVFTTCSFVHLDLVFCCYKWYFWHRICSRLPKVSRPRWLSWMCRPTGDQEVAGSTLPPPPRSATFFREDCLWNIFYGHSLPSADSRRAVVSF